MNTTFISESINRTFGHEFWNIPPAYYFTSVELRAHRTQKKILIMTKINLIFFPDDYFQLLYRKNEFSFVAVCVQNTEEIT